MGFFCHILQSNHNFPLVSIYLYTYAVQIIMFRLISSMSEAVNNHGVINYGDKYRVRLSLVVEYFLPYKGIWYVVVGENGETWDAILFIFS